MIGHIGGAVREVPSATPLGALLCLVLTVSGCTPGTQERPAPVNSPSPITSPLQGLYYILQGGAVDEESGQELQDRISERTAACMKEAGFDLLPSSLGASASDVEFDPLDRDSVAQYGYGITTIPAIDPADDGFPADWSLSQQNAYVAALDGDGRTPGCQQTAYEEVLAGQNAFQTDPRFEALRDELTALWNRVDTDPRVIRLNADWADCMADAGYPDLATPADPSSLVFSITQGVPPDGSIEYREKTLPARDFEVDVALADFDCRDALRFEDAYTRVRVEYEEDVAARFKSDIEALLLEYGE